jgi:Domain of unknown function (DUF6894)
MKYYLHIRDRGLFEQDHEGTDLPNLAAARSEGLKFAQEIWSNLTAPDQAVVEITDSNGLVVWRITAAEIARARGRGFLRVV